MKKGTRNALIFADIFLYISKTKGVQENLTTPRDAVDIFPPKTISRIGKTLFILNTETNEFGKTCGADSGRHAHDAIL